MINRYAQKCTNIDYEVIKKQMHSLKCLLAPLRACMSGNSELLLKHVPDLSDEISS